MTPASHVQAHPSQCRRHDAPLLEEFIIGRCYNGHLGDTLCLSPVPRLLTLAYGTRVYVSDLPSHRGVFASNPYVAGFRQSKGVRLETRIRGHGHLIHRIQRRFGAVLEGDVRPEIYLSEEERLWALEQRRHWPVEKPVCILATRAIAEAKWYGDVDWPAVANTLMGSCTLVQPILTRPDVYRSQIARTPKARPSTWQEETPIPGAVVYRDLPLRKYLSLFSVADCFCGPASGGAHAAAAFDVPSLLVVWRGLLESLRFPASSQGFATEAFLYPQHDYIASEDLDRGSISWHVLRRKIEDMSRRARDRRRAGADRGPAGVRFLTTPPRQRAYTTAGRVLGPSYSGPGLYGAGAARYPASCGATVLATSRASDE